MPPPLASPPPPSPTTLPTSPLMALPTSPLSRAGSCEPRVDLARLQTEDRNPRTNDIDTLSTAEMLERMNSEDQMVALAVGRCIPQIASLVDQVYPRVARGGRVIYVGAGSSGRLGILDASEMSSAQAVLRALYDGYGGRKLTPSPPTFSSPPGQFLGVIAGGLSALTHSVEGAEDSPSTGASDLRAVNLSRFDTVIGLSASGRTPYVLGALQRARSLGCLTAGICCVTTSSLRDFVDIPIECPVGPEAITGSTRLKAGTAQKMILNMVSSGIQVRLGKVHGNLMVDVKRSNGKLRARSRGILRTVLAPYTVGDMGDERLEVVLEECGGVKAAAVALRWRCSRQQAEGRLRAAGGVLRRALQEDVACL